MLVSDLVVRGLVSLLVLSLNEVSCVGGLPLLSSSSSSGVSAIVARLDTQQGLRLRHIVPILERDPDLAAGDLAVIEEALLLPFLDKLSILAFVVLLGCEVPGLVALAAEHRDVADDRAVPVAVAKIGRGVRLVVLQVYLFPCLGTKLRRLDLGVLVLGVESEVARVDLDVLDPWRGVLSGRQSLGQVHDLCLELF